MKNKFLIILSVAFTLCAHLFADTGRSDYDRLSKVIQELENELEKVTKLRDFYLATWMPQVLPWDYEIILNKHRIRILKDIYYFKDLLAKIEIESVIRLDLAHSPLRYNAL